MGMRRIEEGLGSDLDWGRATGLGPVRGRVEGGLGYGYGYGNGSGHGPVFGDVDWQGKKEEGRGWKE